MRKLAYFTQQRANSLGVIIAIINFNLVSSAFLLNNSCKGEQDHANVWKTRVTGTT